MKVSDFDFDLPEDRIAIRPAEPRDAARVLQVSRFLFDFTFGQLPDLLHAGDVVVFNDSRVIPARLFGRCSDREFEVLLHQHLSHGERSKHDSVSGEGKSPIQDPLPNAAVHRSTSPDGRGENIWSAFIRPLKKLKVGDVLRFNDELEATLIEKKESGEAVLSFSVIPANTLASKAGIQQHVISNEASPDGQTAFLDPRLRGDDKREGEDDDFFAILRRIGHMPLPPYIKRSDTAEDATDYQTIYAQHDGSVAAPTAGLHFTPALMKRLHDKGIHTAFVTLHVGAGTFQPVKVDDTADHVMHSEWATISPEAATTINAAKAAGGKVVAVGTTSLRILETATGEDGALLPFTGETDIFITPGYRFKLVDRLVTNFHLPKSTLFMLVCAFAGTDRMKAAYAHAIANRYRFYSYGDGCLLDRVQ